MPTTTEMLGGRPSEGGHWYAQDGRPCYDVLGANGLNRPATLRDARKMGLVPGVSSILQMEAKPQLVNWQIEQALMSALTLPRLASETDDEFIVRAREDSKEQARKAAARGTHIHAAIQGSFEGKPTAAEDLPYVTPVHAWIAQRYGLQGWVAEQSFASPLGYGGKKDLCRVTEVIIDVKCKAFGPGKRPAELAWPEHIMQLAAYDEDRGGDCVNIYVSTDHPGLICVYEWSEQERIEGWEAFLHLFAIWRIRKKFNPAFERLAA